MNTCDIAFVAFEEFDNLSTGYLVSVLSENGYKSKVIDFRLTKEEILNKILSIKPVIVGFSVIFQNHIDDFAELAAFLRKKGVASHFTAGGHYASLNYNELFKVIPYLDSIIRFDGEYTILELVRCFNTGNDWRNIAGIVFKNDGKTVINPLRPPEPDLDNYPIPTRSSLKEYALGKKFATILAGRGCINNCSYCSIREYNRQSSGPIKRIRKAEKVVSEIEFLKNEMECSVYLFQDDDFPVKTREGGEWIRRFCKELNSRNLVDSIMWKINCRPDEVDYETFSMMKEHGLFLVFLGIEDGTDEGLKHMNKNMTVAKCLEGVNILKKLELGLDYGFMLFQPTTTFISAKENLIFLRTICSDGSTPVSFMKMMPYSGTLIKKQLNSEGRLKGRSGFQDYSFPDPLMDDYHNFIEECFMEWLRSDKGILNLTKWARNYIMVFSKYHGVIPEVTALYDNLKKVVSESNIFLLDLLQELIMIFDSGENIRLNTNDLNNYRELIYVKQELFKKQINDIIFEVIAHYHLFKYFQPLLY